MGQAFLSLQDSILVLLREKERHDLIGLSLRFGKSRSWIEKAIHALRKSGYDIVNVGNGESHWYELMG